MSDLLVWSAALSFLLWAGFVLAPGCPWRNREVLDADESDQDEALDDITVVIPARNEADLIQRALRSLIAQDCALEIVLVDDRSEDATEARARALAHPNLRIVEGAPPPPGWIGKLWALEQGRREAASRLLLFLDADIELAPGLVKTLRSKMRRDAISFISLTAAPPLFSLGERLLMPAFIYFFKALYPFHWVNSPNSKRAAAAGGCILLESRVLDRIGGLESIKSALIDDCTLAQRVKNHGFKIWLGLTHSAESVRRYKTLKEIGDMIARCAFAQLRYSPALLILCTGAMLLLFALPAVLLAPTNQGVRVLALGSVALMCITYLPTLRFYHRSAAQAVCLPFIALFFLVMTWVSALRFWRGERARWKGRIYPRREDDALDELRSR